MTRRDLRRACSDGEQICRRYRGSGPSADCNACEREAETLPTVIHAAPLLVTARFCHMDDTFDLSIVLP